MKDIVIISYFYAPANVMAAIRMSKISKYLKKDGYSVSVITSSNQSILFMKENGGFDSILDSDTKNLNIVRISHSKTYRHICGFLRKRINSQQFDNPTKAADSNSKITLRKKIVHYISFFMMIYQDYDFAKRSKKYIKKHYKNFENKIIISSFGPIASHLLALKIRKNNKWIADFRDPIANESNFKLEYKINKFFERKFIKNADKVVAVSNGYLKSLGLVLNEKNYVITNGFDNSDIIISAKQDSKLPFVFSYVGTLYSGKRDMTPLFKALFDLVNENRINKGDVFINYAGPQGNLFECIAEEYGFQKQILNYGYVERCKSLEIQNDSDAILVLTWNNKKDSGILPGKFFEALMFKKPIVGLISGIYSNSEMKQIIDSNGFGVAYESSSKNDFNNLKEFLFKLIVDHSNKNKLKNFGNNGFYSYENITKRYERIINELE